MSRVDSEPKPLEKEFQKTAHTLTPFVDAIRRILPHRGTKHKIRRIAFDPFRTLGPHPRDSVELPRKPKG